MSIREKVKELNAVKQELKQLSMKTTKLRKYSVKLENDISKYLDAKDQPGLKYQGIAIIKETKSKRKNKKKNDQFLDAVHVLKENNVQNPEKVLEELLEARKGEKIDLTRLKFTTYKN